MSNEDKEHFDKINFNNDVINENPNEEFSDEEISQFNRAKNKIIHNSSSDEDDYNKSNEKESPSIGKSNEIYQNTPLILAKKVNNKNSIVSKIRKLFSPESEIEINYLIKFEPTKIIPDNENLNSSSIEPNKLDSMFNQIYDDFNISFTNQNIEKFKNTLANLKKIAENYEYSYLSNIIADWLNQLNTGNYTFSQIGTITQIKKLLDTFYNSIQQQNLSHANDFGYEERFDSNDFYDDGILSNIVPLKYDMEIKNFNYQDVLNQIRELDAIDKVDKVEEENENKEKIEKKENDKPNFLKGTSEEKQKFLEHYIKQQSKNKAEAEYDSMKYPFKDESLCIVY